MNNNLKDKVVVVIGASKGIGNGIAKEMGAAGAKVVVNYNTDKVGADIVVSQIEKYGGTAVVIKASVSKEDEV